MLRYFTKSLSNKVKTPVYFSVAGSTAAYLMNNSAAFEEQKQSKIDTVKAPLSELSDGYQALFKHSYSLKQEAAVAGIVSPMLAGSWLLLSSRTLASSPVAIALLLAGGWLVSDRSIQVRRINKFVKSNLIVHPESVLRTSTQDSTLRKIIAGNHPNITFNKNGITVTGPIGDDAKPSILVQETLKQIKNTNKFVIPHAVLNPAMQKSTDLVHDRWLSAITVPLSLLTVIAIASKDSKERNADDYVVGASATYNLVHYFSGPSLVDSRELISMQLRDAKTPEEVIQRLVDLKFLTGGMNFLEDWVRNDPSIGVRVSKTGSLVLHRSRMFSIGDPYPLQRFPQLENNEDPATENSNTDNLDPRPW